MLDFATDLLKFFFQENIPCPKSPEKIKTVKSKRQKQGKVNIYGDWWALLSIMKYYFSFIWELETT